MFVCYLSCYSSTQHTSLMAADSRAVSVSEVDATVLQQINKQVDTVLQFSKTDAELQNSVLKFQLEQAADKAAFESKGGNVDRGEHLRRVLVRMSDLALAVASAILKRTTADMQSRASDADPSTTDALHLTPSLTGPAVADMVHASSVEDFSKGSDAWLQGGALLSSAAVNLLSLVLTVHKELRNGLQMHMLHRNVIDYVNEALGVSREHEIRYFLEGYKTDHMRLIANIAFENTEIGDTVADNDHLLRAILSATKIDEENPGMVEWAEFAIRNLCSCSPLAQEKIRQLTPVGLTPESEKMLAGKMTYHFTSAGKVSLSTAHANK